MSSELIVILIIVGAVVLFTLEIFPIEVSSMLIMVSLMLTGVISVEEAVSGFSNPAALTVLAMLIISAGLKNTGLIDYLVRQSLQLKMNDEALVMAVIMTASGVISAFMNNTAVVAIFLPMIMRIAHEKELNINKLLIALSFGAMLGGSCTVIGSSTNLLVSDVSDSHAVGSIEMFELTPVGIILFVVSTLFLVFIGRYLVPERRVEKDKLTTGYQVEAYLTSILVTSESDLIGMNLDQIQQEKLQEVAILQVIRGQDSAYLPEDVSVLKENDVLIVKANAKRITELSHKYNLEIKALPALDLENDSSSDHGKPSGKRGVLVEVIIGPDSHLAGKKIRDVLFRSQYKVVPIAVRGMRGLQIENLEEITLNVGFALLLETTEAAVPGLYASDDFILMKEIQRKELVKEKAIIALGVIAGVVLLASFNVIPILVSAWLGCVALLITRCISMRKAYDMIDWKVYFLLSGIIPLGIALEKSGMGSQIADLITNVLSPYGPEVIISGLFITTALISGYISNNAVAVLLAPIALTIANNLGLDPKAFLLTIIFAANSAYLTPIGYQTNTMIYSAGQFKFKDFLLTGGALTFIVWILVTFVIPALYF